MKLKGVNASSRKTKTLIKKTFAQLVQEKKEINKITVSELVKKADITRGTFYSHYDNIYQVAAEFQEEILDVFFSTEKKFNNVNACFDQVVIFLKEQEKTYKMLLAADETLIFMKRLNKIICTELYNHLKSKQTKNLELNISFFTDGAINLFLKYFRQEINLSLDEINDYLKNMFQYMFIK